MTLLEAKLEIWLGLFDQSARCQPEKNRGRMRDPR
jgi:hypothetical protein